MRWTHIRRAIPGLLALGVALLLGHGAAALDALPLASALQEYDTATVVQFHPSDPTTVADLDRLAARAAADILAVCVGQGCTQGVTENIARERGWPFRLAFDPRGSLAGAVQEAASAIAQSPLQSAVATLRPSFPLPGTSQARPNRSMTASMSTPGLPGFVSARGFLIVALPVMLLGLGGMAFFVGSRRRKEAPEQDVDEDQQLQDLIRARHGRKRPPVR